MIDFTFELLENIVQRVKVGFVGSVNEFYCDSSVSGSVPIIRTTDIEDFDIKKLKYVTKEFHDKNKKSQIFKGDLIIARHGSNGNAMIYDLEDEAQVLNAVIIRPDINKMNSSLLKLHFDSPYIKNQIKGCIKGSVQGVINTKHVAELKIPFNDSINYSRVTDFVSDLDAKIEVNNKINQELESLAKTIYDYWFVQFDFPDHNGKPYKSSGGKMKYNEELKREIPEGWESNTMADWIDNDANGDWGEAEPTGKYNVKVNCIRGADLPSLDGFKNNESPIRYIHENKTHKILESNDLIVEISGGSPTQSTGRISFVTKETFTRYEAPLICANFCKSVRLKNSKKLYNFYYTWKEAFEQGNMFNYEGKTSGIRNLLFSALVNNFKVPLPDSNLVDKFYDFMQPIQKQKQRNLLENQKLAALRDWLLPMLMNGQVTVGEAKEQLGMVAENKETYKQKLNE